MNQLSNTHLTFLLSITLSACGSSSNSLRPEKSEKVAKVVSTNYIHEVGIGTKIRFNQDVDLELDTSDDREKVFFSGGKIVRDSSYDTYCELSRDYSPQAVSSLIKAGTEVEIKEINLNISMVGETSESLATDFTDFSGGLLLQCKNLSHRVNQFTNGILIQELAEISGNRISVLVDEKTAISPLQFKFVKQPTPSIYNLFSSGSAEFNIDFKNQPPDTRSLLMSGVQGSSRQYCSLYWNPQSPPHDSILYRATHGEIFFGRKTDRRWSGTISMVMSIDNGLFFTCGSDDAESLSLESIKSTLGSLVEFTPGTNPLGYEVLFR